MFVERSCTKIYPNRLPSVLHVSKDLYPMSPIDTTKRFVLALPLMALLAIAGCSTDSSPTASIDAEGIEATAPTAVFSLGYGAGPAAKSMGADVATGDRGARHARKGIGPRGGMVIVREGRGADKLNVTLLVPARSVRETEIDMVVSGDRLSNLSIAFAPGGLEFVRKATLRIRLGRNRVDSDVRTIPVVHTSSTGEVTTHHVRVNHKSNGDVVINIRIPGFSRYSLGE
jgi:hypothetical protein